MRNIFSIRLFIALISCKKSLAINWGSTLRSPDIAESESVLDPHGDLKLHWSVNYKANRVTFNLHFSEKAPSFNWLAIGFSDRGRLQGADLCLLWTDYKGTTNYEDTYVDYEGRVHRDEHQDCNNFVLREKTGVLTFERNFDTCDEQDYVIEDGTTHIVWARGPDTLFSSEGLSPASSSDRDHGFIRVRIMTPPSQPKPKSKILRITNNKVKLPSSDTTYWCKIFELPDYVTEKMHHIVQYQSSIQSGNEGLVHHMEMFYCDTEPHQEIPLYDGPCFSTERPNITQTCSKVKAAWAMGAKPFTYPRVAGLPLGGPKANKYVMLEVHYNNPEKKDDWVDSSGILIHVTSKLRQFDAGIMELGLEYIDKMAIPPGQTEFPLVGFCVPECTSVGLPRLGIVVFGSQLHTHLTGVQVKTEHFRNGVELPILNQDKHYSTHFQEIRILRRPVHIRPGDLLVTTCLYDTRERVNATIGGHAITDEMCVNYMHYYPASDLEVCKSSVSSKYLADYFGFEYRLDEMKTDATKSPRENFLSINPWTPLRVKSLFDLYDESPLSMQCNKSDGSRFQGNWEDFPLPKIKTKLPNLHRQCFK